VSQTYSLSHRPCGRSSRRRTPLLHAESLATVVTRWGRKRRGNRSSTGSRRRKDTRNTDSQIPVKSKTDSIRGNTRHTNMGWRSRGDKRRGRGTDRHGRPAGQESDAVLPPAPGHRLQLGREASRGRPRRPKWQLFEGELARKPPWAT